MPKFDQYNCTFHEVDPLEIVRLIERAFPFAQITPDRPKFGYLTGQVVTLGGDPVCRVWWDGNPGVHVICHSHHAEKLAPLLRGYAGHELVRADACLDLCDEGYFDSLSAYFIDFAKVNKLTINQLGDWARGQSRTLYIGSRTSTYMLRIYEKGWQTGGDKNWVRVEAEIKPKGEVMRRTASTMTAKELLWCSKWGAAALEGFGWEKMLSKTIGTVYRPSDDERARLAIQKQYGQILKRWFDESGDPSVFAAELLELGSPALV